MGLILKIIDITPFKNNVDQINIEPEFKFNINILKTTCQHKTWESSLQI